MIINKIYAGSETNPMEVIQISIPGEKAMFGICMSIDKAPQSKQIVGMKPKGR